MKITKHLKVPTGDILVVDGDKGKLEMLSLGDYGSNVNLKARFLGRDKDIAKVEHGAMLPLEKKWVITVSTQYGCGCRCNFCDVPAIKFNGNATLNDLQQQILTGIHLHPEVVQCEHLNIHFARMGEPSFNPQVLECAKWIKEHLYRNGDGQLQYKAHPVVSTMMPRHNEWLKVFIHNWMRIKNRVYEGNAGLQLSINSTNEDERDKMFNHQALPLWQIAKIMDGVVPFGRKITLNFAVAGYEIDPAVLLRYFDPSHYVVKLTPMHKTKKCVENDIKTEGDYTTFHPYQAYEEALVKAGYDVLVFIASVEEDLGRVTCGNAILSGTVPMVPYTMVF